MPSCARYLAPLNDGFIREISTQFGKYRVRVTCDALLSSRSTSCWEIDETLSNRRSTALSIRSTSRCNSLPLSNPCEKPNHFKVRKGNHFWAPHSRATSKAAGAHTKRRSDGMINSGRHEICRTIRGKE